MSNASITAQIASNKTIPGIAEQLVGNRTLNPDYQLCPVWNGQDLAGRPVCVDSFYTKYAGCNSSLDRIKVENFLRPAYMNFVTQSATGIAGVEADFGSNLPATASAALSVDRQNKQAITGKFGTVSAEAVSRNSNMANVLSSNAYQNSQDVAALRAQQQRNAQALGIGNASQTRMNHSGATAVNKNVTYTWDRNSDYMFNNSKKRNQNDDYLTLNSYKTPVNAPSILLA